jgi:hypothetical protein
MNDLNDKLEPRWRKSSTEKELPNRVNPYTDKDEPMRPKLLMDSELPTVMKSRTDSVLPNLTMPKTDKAEPRREKLLSDNEDPICT